MWEILWWGVNDQVLSRATRITQIVRYAVVQSTIGNLLFCFDFHFCFAAFMANRQAIQYDTIQFQSFSWYLCTKRKRIRQKKDKKRGPSDNG